VGEAWGLLFDREQGFRRDPEDGKPRETTADQVCQLLEDQPGLMLPQLVEATGKADRTVRAALRELGAVGEGLPKRWELPSDAQVGLG
jgi:hypothetical protein